MNVEQSSRVTRGELRRQDPHETGEHDELRRQAIDRRGKRLVERRARGMLAMCNGHGLDLVCSRELETRRSALIANDRHDWHLRLDQRT
jgi:hypothetical protein